MEDSIFTKIIKKEIPAKVHFEDEEFIVFDDIHPQAPIHVLVVPKKQIPTLEGVAIEDSDFHANLLKTGRKVAAQLGIADNYRLVMNVGKDVQAVLHIHLHLMGGWKNLDQARTEKF